MSWMQGTNPYGWQVVRSRHPTDEDFKAQLDAFEELAAIDNRLRWIEKREVERYLAEKRRSELIGRIEAWKRRFAWDDVEGHGQQGA